VSQPGTTPAEGSEVTARIRAFIVEELLAPQPAGSFNDDTPILSGLLDSGALMRLMVFLEEEFDVQIDDEDVVADHFASVRHIDRLIESKRETAGSS
jgi:acyl carrier protein